MDNNGVKMARVQYDPVAHKGAYLRYISENFQQIVDS